YERLPELAVANPSAKDIKLETARNTGPIPLHPGAKQALDSLGAR
ncbi:TAXI family TRAP transporter solute-binding subunit, partial [Pseudonocardia sp.]